MKKYFIVADVHGYFSVLQISLNKAGYDKTNPDHVFVSLGDLLDRGNQPVSCLKFVLSIPSTNRILIRGNHEELIQNAINRDKLLWHDYSNGTALTIAELKCTKDGMKLWDQYLEQTVPYARVENNVFTHGWIPCIKENTRPSRDDISYTFDDNWENGDWTKAAWTNGMDAWNKGIRLPDTTIFCGHYHTSWGHHHIDHTSQEWPNRRSTNPAHQTADFSPFVHPGIVALDACTALSGKINVYILEA